MNNSRNTYRYIHLKEKLLEELVSGNFKKGDSFYTERQVMDKYKFSYATVSRALKELAEGGFFKRVKGHGTFVTEYGLLNCQGIKIQPESLYIVSSSIKQIKAYNPNSWFVYDEIQKGIINSYNGPVKFAAEEEIREKICNKEKIRAIAINVSADFANVLKASGGKSIFINHRRDRNAVFSNDSVSWEMLLGTYELMSYLTELGHSRIGFIGSGHPDRYAGYQIGLKAYDIQENNDYVLNNPENRSEEDGYNAMKQLLALKNPPTAIFADTDLKAYGVIRAAQEAGLKVPEDISVAGFDDRPGAEDFEPSLTTVKIPFYRMGATAVDLLMKKISNGGIDIKTEILKSNLIIRNSCSPLKERSQA